MNFSCISMQNHTNYFSAWNDSSLIFTEKKNAVIIIIVFELHFTRKLFTILCYKRPLQQKPPRFLHCWWQCNDKFRYNWGLKTWFGPNLLPSLVRGHLAFEWKRFDHHLKKNWVPLKILYNFGPKNFLR